MAGTWRGFVLIEVLEAVVVTGLALGGAARLTVSTLHQEAEVGWRMEARLAVISTLESGSPRPGTPARLALGPGGDRLEAWVARPTGEGRREVLLGVWRGRGPGA